MADNDLAHPASELDTLHTSLCAHRDWTDDLNARGRTCSPAELTAWSKRDRKLRKRTIAVLALNEDQRELLGAAAFMFVEA